MFGFTSIDQILRDVVEGCVVQRVESEIQPLLRHQLIVVALLDGMPVLQHDDPVGAADGGQTVRDNDAGAALKELRQRLLDQHLGIAVDRGGRLVEHQDA